MDTSRCVKSVSHGSFVRSHQCTRKSGYGPKGIFCKLHDPVAVKRRAKKREERFDAKMEQRERPYKLARLGLKLADQVILYADLGWRGCRLENLRDKARELLKIAK